MSINTIDHSLSWYEFWNASVQVSERFSPMLKKGDRVVVPKDDILSALLTIGACLLTDAIPVFDERDMLSREGCLRPEVGLFLGLDLKNNRPIEFDWQEFMDDDSLGLIISTSGSSGHPKAIEKSWGGLFREASYLETLHQLAPASSIASFVKPFHLYGILHSFLLPLINRGSVYFPQKGSLQNISLLKPSIDLLVSTPAHWAISKHTFKKREIRRFVTSGSRFSEHNRRELMALPNKPDHCINIIGSSETGGFAYSRLDQSPLFKAFDTVTMINDAKEISSPFTLPRSTVYTLDDVFEICDSGELLFKGRGDRCFKHNGHKFSLVEIENVLEKISGNEAICSYVEQPMKERGELLGFIANTKKADLRSLAEKFNAEYPGLPCPELIMVDQIPRNDLGKKSLGSLKK